MSRGPGKIERSLTELFTQFVGTDAVLSVSDLCRHAFGNSAPTRSQRISVLRAAHRVIARARTRHKTSETSDLVRVWRMTERADRTVVFHDRYYPVRVWAVEIAQQGVIWAEAEISSITKSRVNIRYDGEPASLNRRMLGDDWAVWRGVQFVSERNGYAAWQFEDIWASKYGHLFPTRLPLDKAKRLLGVPHGYTREDVISAFRRAAHRCHPDHGGTAEEFRALIEARDRLLASIGFSAPKAPKFEPSGVKLHYVSVSSSSKPRLGGRERPLLESPYHQRYSWENASLLVR